MGVSGSPSPKTVQVQGFAWRIHTDPEVVIFTGMI